MQKSFYKSVTAGFLSTLISISTVYLAVDKVRIGADAETADPSLLDAAAKTYYLDSAAAGGGDGSMDHPFNSLQQANALTLKGGDKLLLKRGSNFRGTLYPKGSGSKGKEILISAYGEGALPLIDAGGSQFMPVNGQRDRKGPFVDENNPVYGSAVYLYNQEYITVENLHLTNAGPNRNFADADRSGIRVEAYDYGVVRGITIRNNYIENVQGFNGQDDIWTSQAVDATGRKIPNTTPFYGARTTHRTGGINLITYTAREPEATNEHGVKYQALDLSKKLTIFDGVLIENNYINNVQANGITLTNVKGELDNESYRHRHVVIRNNKIVNVSRSGIIPLYTSGVIVEGNYIDTFQSTTAGYGCGVWNDRADNMKFINNIVRNGVNTNDGMAFNLDDMTRDGLIANNLIINNAGGGVMLHIRDNSYNRNHRIEGNLFINNGADNFANNHVAQIVAVGENARTKIQNALVINNTFIQDGVARMISHGDELLLKRNIFYSKNPQLASKDVNQHFNVGPNSVFIDNIFYGSEIPTKGARALFSGNVKADPLLNLAGASSNPSFYNQILHANSPALKTDTDFANSGLLNKVDVFGNPFTGNIGAYYGSGETVTDETAAFGVEDERVTKIGTPIVEVEREASISGKIYKFTQANDGVSFKFSGQSLFVYMKKGPGAGKADVLLDEQKVGEIDLYNPGRPQFRAMVFSLNNIAPGEHTLKILNNGQKNAASSNTAVNFDYFKIRNNLLETEIPAKNLTAIGSPTVENDPHSYSGQVYKFTNAGNGMETNFTGTGFALFMKKGPGAGRAKIYLDDAEIAEIDLYNAKFAVYNNKVFEQTGLENREHRLRVLVSEQKNVQSQNTAVNFERLVVYKAEQPHKRVYMSDMEFRSDNLPDLQVPMTFNAIGFDKRKADTVTYTVTPNTATIENGMLRVSDYGDYQVAVNVQVGTAVYSATATYSFREAEVALGEQVLSKYFVQHNDKRLQRIGEPQIDEEQAAISKSVAKFTKSGEGVILQFYGSGVEVFTRNGPAAGIIELELDGEVHEINTYSANKKLAVSIFKNLRLPKGNHTIKIKLKAESAQSNKVFNLDGFTVYGYALTAVKALDARIAAEVDRVTDEVLIFDNNAGNNLQVYRLPDLNSTATDTLYVAEDIAANYQAMRNYVAEHYQNLRYARSYDIKILDSNLQAIQPPNGPLFVQIPLTNDFAADYVPLVLVTVDNNRVVELGSANYRVFVAANGDKILELQLEHLSNVSVLVAEEKKTAESSTVAIESSTAATESTPKVTTEAGTETSTEAAKTSEATVTTEVIETTTETSATELNETTEVTTETTEVTETTEATETVVTESSTTTAATSATTTTVKPSTATQTTTTVSSTATTSKSSVTAPVATKLTPTTKATEAPSQLKPIKKQVLIAGAAENKPTPKRNLQAVVKTGESKFISAYFLLLAVLALAYVRKRQHSNK